MPMSPPSSHPFTYTAWAEIDLEALRHNARQARRLAGDARIMAMLKADAYGHGLLPCARALADLVDGIGVARLEAAEALRRALPDLRIMLTAATLDADALNWCAAHRIDVVVHEAEVLSLILDMPQAPGVWLKANTGMNRLGMSAPAFHAALRALRQRGVDVIAMTHFASADLTTSEDTVRQIAAFDAMLTDWPDLPCSLCNSAGLMRWSQARRDWVRPGIMLYGCNPLEAPAPVELRPVMTLKARVLAVNPIGVGEAVGYGGTWRASRSGRIATVGLGYGDGFPRLTNPPLQVRVNGQPAPLIGRVSMDLLALDVTDLEHVSRGDVVTLWGEECPVENVAQAAGTISYELLCQLQGRVPRIYRG